jgi:hypothetical protein
VRDITQAPSLAHHLAGMINGEDLKKWLEDLPRSQPITRIDPSGDTPLTAALKAGLSVTLPDAALGAIVERMVKIMGADIRVRDRNGGTALAAWIAFSSYTTSGGRSQCSPNCLRAVLYCTNPTYKSNLIVFLPIFSGYSR